MANYRGKYQKNARFRPFFWAGIVCCIFALFCGAFLGLFLLSGIQAKREQRQTAARYAPSAPAAEPAASEAAQPDTAAETAPGKAHRSEEATEEPTEPQTTAPPRFPTIDFAGLREKNPDVVAWLRIPALEAIDAPVVLGQDNAHYTTHGWDGTESDHGAIFLDYQNSADFSQVHSILYGHCMKDGTMFQTLGKWEGERFFAEQDRTLLLFLPEETRVYEIFAVERVNALDSRVYATDYTAGTRWAEALEKTAQASRYPVTQALGEDSQVLTLSTCMGDMERLVVHALCVERVPQ